MVLTVVLVLVGVGAAEEPSTNPHDNPASGVLRVLTDPTTRGQCSQCHPMHGTSGATEAQARALFGENTNALAYWTETVSPCHPERPVNYPLGENDRLPDIDADAGYFEANDGGLRRVGVQYRGRWPGRLVYTNAEMTPGGRYVSPHAMDPDMPRRDAGGEGLCLNCHDPHGEAGHRDLLVDTYRGIGGHAAVGPPEQYRLCFSCHGADGPGGMDLRNRYIEDYYDAGLNGPAAGHQIRKNPAIALSWPSHIQVGDMLSCSDCHNAHGSRGYNGAQPNGFLISDQRPGWSGLNNTLNDAGQARRFCLGCHIPADGIPGTQTVAGIVMNTLSDEEAHRSTALESCYDCHGRDYSNAAGHNVHNPLTGSADAPWGGEGW
jgi:5-methylcytosine-specific restriction endonuclease McrA/cytochrome c553